MQDVDVGKLSPREREVAIMLGHGKPCKEIAAQLGISVKTVDTHRHHVLRKLGHRNTVELALRLVRENLIVP